MLKSIENIIKEFDKLKIFSTPLEGEKEGLLTFVVYISVAEDFLRTALTEYKEGIKEETTKILDEFVVKSQPLCEQNTLMFLLKEKIKNI